MPIMNRFMCKSYQMAAKIFFLSPQNENDLNGVIFAIPIGIGHDKAGEEKKRVFFDR
jgi:hypothetical protein